MRRDETRRNGCRGASDPKNQLAGAGINYDLGFLLEERLGFLGIVMHRIFSLAAIATKCTDRPGRWVNFTRLYPEKVSFWSLRIFPSQEPGSARGNYATNLFLRRVTGN
jgi:hypothetical protein